MIRGLNFILLLACACALVAVYGVKTQSEAIAGEKAGLERQIAEQEEKLSYLRADWAYLNQPSHIEPIITRHAETLELVVATAEQFKSILDLPFRPAKPDADALTDLLEALESGNDPIAALIEAN